MPAAKTKAKTEPKLPPLTYKPDAKTPVAYFEKIKSESKDADRRAEVDKIRKLKLTEAQLIARAFEVSGCTIDEFIRMALVTASKSLIVNVKPATNKEHDAAYKRLQKAGMTNITPSRLFLEAGTNFRSAEHYLKSKGLEYVSQANPDRPRKSRTPRLVKGAPKRAKRE